MIPPEPPGYLTRLAAVLAERADASPGSKLAGRHADGVCGPLCPFCVGEEMAEEDADEADPFRDNSFTIDCHFGD